MKLVLDIPAELENMLAARAEHQGLALDAYILRILGTQQPAPNGPRTGAELVAHWQREGLIGTRDDLADSQSHARELREHAQRRLCR